jgi:hypothetical protein
VRLAGGHRLERIRHTFAHMASRDACVAEPTATKEAPMQNISIRFATHDDAPALDRLAQRDTRRLPAAPHLVAEVDGRILVARSVVTGEAVADPFTRTAELRAMVAIRAAQLAERRPRRLAAPWLRGYPRLQAQ